MVHSRRAPRSSPRSTFPLGCERNLWKRCLVRSLSPEPSNLFSARASEREGTFAISSVNSVSLWQPRNLRPRGRELPRRQGSLSLLFSTMSRCSFPLAAELTLYIAREISQFKKFQSFFFYGVFQQGKHLTLRLKGVEADVPLSALIDVSIFKST